MSAVRCRLQGRYTSIIYDLVQAEDAVLQGRVDLLDSRTLQVVKKIPFEDPAARTQSISVKGNILTIGTYHYQDQEQGSLLFWDMKADKFLQNAIKLPSPIFTHCLDTTGSRLFAAGEHERYRYPGHEEVYSEGIYLVYIHSLQSVVIKMSLNLIN